MRQRTWQKTRPESLTSTRSARPGQATPPSLKGVGLRHGARDREQPDRLRPKPGTCDVYDSDSDGFICRGALALKLSFHWRQHGLTQHLMTAVVVESLSLFI